MTRRRGSGDGNAATNVRRPPGTEGEGRRRADTQKQGQAEQLQGPEERAVAAPLAHNHLWALYNSTPDIVVIVDADGRALGFDPGRADLYFCQRDPTHMRGVRRYTAVEQAP